MPARRRHEIRCFRTGFSGMPAILRWLAVMMGKQRNSAGACSVRAGSGVNHSVTNQTPPYAGGNAWRADPLPAVHSPGFFRRCALRSRCGRKICADAGGAQDLARLANAELPKLRTHDRQGRRIDHVDLHPAWHALMRRGVASGLHSSIWENDEAEKGKRHQACWRCPLLPRRPARKRPSLPADHDQCVARRTDGLTALVPRMGAAHHYAQI